jgi:thiamine transport system ATP-binding protein
VLVRDQPVLLLDEPFASLGPALRREMLELVRALHHERGMTVLMVTHHPEDARAIADRVAFLADGRIAACEETPVMFSPRAPAAFRDYIGT